ncbi:MAG: aminotransferase class III-fold pyridoxal phosphate-dependent enzyme [Myxococcales bacterium]|nr:MAG: aminotransferase class III-fold pyridoxal phosphate-dependent enzyme [Myxococcales bacterium]
MKLSASAESAVLHREAELAERYLRSRALLERARRSIPGGFHLSGRPLVDDDTTPLYFEGGRGAIIRDVDGHEYVDFLMAFGAHLLGYAREEVDRAAAEQARRGGLLSLNHSFHVQLVEALLPKLPGAEMGAFFKTGSEATTAALRIARAHTGRRMVVRAGYHGWHDWCLPLESFVPRGLDAQVLEFRANDPGTLERILAEHGKDVAAVILAPEMVLPFEPAVLHELLRLTHSHGALLVMDEVKTGLRIAPGSISERIGLVPDLITVSKALANGWPLAFVAGKRHVMQAAAGMHYSATYHGDTVAMAACLATLEVAEAEKTREHVELLGQRLIDGLNGLAQELDVPARAYGEPLSAMPFFRFTYPEPAQNALVTRLFYREVLARGFLLHPRHLWFICGAHTQQQIEQTLGGCRSALVASLQLLRS